MSNKVSIEAHTTCQWCGSEQVQRMDDLDPSEFSDAKYGRRYVVDFDTEPPAWLTTVPEGLHPSARSLLKYFEYEHLPRYLQAVSLPFCVLAYRIVNHVPNVPEATVALRKLLEAKDCAVRAMLERDGTSEANIPEVMPRRGVTEDTERAG